VVLDLAYPLVWPGHSDDVTSSYVAAYSNFGIPLSACSTCSLHAHVRLCTDHSAIVVLPSHSHQNSYRREHTLKDLPAEDGTVTVHSHRTNIKHPLQRHVPTFGNTSHPSTTNNQYRGPDILFHCTKSWRIPSRRFVRRSSWQTPHRPTRLDRMKELQR